MRGEVLTIALLDHNGVRVLSGLFGLGLAQFEDVDEAVQRHLDDLGVHHGQQLAQRRDAVLQHGVDRA